MTESPRAKRLSLRFLVLLTAIVLYLGSIIARPFLTSIVTATVLAIALYPLFVRVRRRIRNGSGAALLVTLLVLIAMLVPPVLLVNRVAHEITALNGWLMNGKHRRGVGASTLRNLSIGHSDGRQKRLERRSSN